MIRRISGFMVKRPNVKNIILLTFFLFLSRGLGLLRQIFIYQRMDPFASDLLLAGTKIPDTIVSLLLMGTVISSVLPIASRLSHKREKGGDLQTRYLNLMIFSLISILFLIIVFLMIWTETFLKLSTSSQTINEFVALGVWNDYINVTRILLIGPMLFGLQSVLGVFLNLKNRFFVYSLAGTIYNLGTILGLAFGPRNNYFLVAWGMMIGAAVSVGLFYWESTKEKFFIPSPAKMVDYLKESYSLLKKDFWMTWKLFLPRIFLLNGVIVANLLINLVAQDGGQITSFDIGLSIQGVFFSIITSVTAVAFPNLANLFNKKGGDNHAFWNKLRKYTLGVLVLSFLGTIVTIVFSPLVIWLFELFGSGQGTGDYIIMIARITSVALIFQSMVEMLNKYFYVREKIWEPVIIANVGLVGQIIILFSLINNGVDAGVSVSVSLIGNFVISFLLILFYLTKDYFSFKQSEVK